MGIFLSHLRYFSGEYHCFPLRIVLQERGGAKLFEIGVSETARELRVQATERRGSDATLVALALAA